MIALIIIAIVIQILQWRYSKKCIDKISLIAQEWRDTAEALNDEINTRTLQEQLDEQATSHHQKVSVKKNHTS